MALFPLALPIIALTLVAGLPLLLIAVAVGLPAALVTAPILVARRGLRARRPNPGSDRDRLVPARTDALGRSTPLTSQGGGR
jgi:hypothetical protein